MRSLKQEASGLRVLMRMPDLSPAAAAAPAVVAEPQRETFVQMPLAPLAAAATAAPAPAGKKKTISRPETQGVMPEELKRPGRMGKALTALAVLAVAAAIGIALSNRTRQDEPEASIPEEIVAAITPEMPGDEVPGGTPTEITQIPEISFPAETAPTAKAAPTAEAEAMKIQRLPTVEGKTSAAQAVADGASAKASDSAAAGQTATTPGVARLSSRIEQPQPQISR